MKREDSANSERITNRDRKHKDLSERSNQPNLAAKKDHKNY